MFSHLFLFFVFVLYKFLCFHFLFATMIDSLSLNPPRTCLLNLQGQWLLTSVGIFCDQLSVWTEKFIQSPKDGHVTKLVFCLSFNHPWSLEAKVFHKCKYIQLHVILYVQQCSINSNKNSRSSATICTMNDHWALDSI